MAKYLIYGLADPRTQELRYVGQTCYLPCQRLAQHEHAARRSKDTRRNTQWIRSLQSTDVRPEMFEIESGLTKAEANETESFYISYFRSIGCRLNNHTDGGEGSVGYRHSPEIRAKMSALRTGRKFGEASNVTRRKLSSDQEQELVKLYQTGLSLDSTGLRFDMSGTGVLKVLKRLGIRRRNSAEGRWLTERQKVSS
jgi:hypothetical protein